MDRLLERLREQQEWYSEGHGPLHKESADEIERLRSALRIVAAYWDDYHVPCVYEEYDNDCDICPVISAVRAALEPS